MRRSATLSMARGEGGSIVRLRVDVERRDTDRREWVRHDAQRLSDSPAYTPIERDSATTERQNTVWTLVRRDVMRERDLLSELQEYFERRSEPEPVEASDD